MSQDPNVDRRSVALEDKFDALTTEISILRRRGQIAAAVSVAATFAVLLTSDVALQVYRILTRLFSLEAFLNEALVATLVAAVAALWGRMRKARPPGC